LIELSVPTHRREQLVDVTEQVAAAAATTGVDAGLCHVYTPHTTCAVTVNEGHDADVQSDFLQHLEELVPRSRTFQHTEGNSDSHIKSILVGSSVILPVDAGLLQLGTWQRVYLCEFDGPRQRQLWVSVQAGGAR
jgi:secondary thiamine-phosphate synthase enzyme